MQAGGERTYLKKLLEHWGDKPIKDIDQAEIDAAAIVLHPEASPATRNRQVYTPTSAVLNHAGIAMRLKRPIGAGGQKTTSWLWPDQAFRLFEAAAKRDAEFAALLIVLTYTGLRLSEALGLTWNMVRLKEGFAYVPDTKNSEPRPVFLPPVAVAALGNLPQRADDARLFRFSKSSRLYKRLRDAASGACVNFPKRSAFHLLRHTYATWMRRFGGLDTKGLVATGAWKDRKSADRYEHVVVSEEAQKAMLLPTPRVRRGKGGGK